MTANRIYFDGGQVELGLVPLGDAADAPATADPAKPSSFLQLDHAPVRSLSTHAVVNLLMTTLAVSASAPRAPTFQQGKAPPEVVAHSQARNPNLFPAAQPIPPGKQVTESAPHYHFGITDTSSGMPAPLRAGPVGDNRTESAPQAFFSLTDTSRGTPITLSSPVGLPVGKQQTASAPAVLGIGADTSASAYAAQHVPPRAAQQTASAPAVPQGFQDTSTSAYAAQRAQAGPPPGRQETGSAPPFLAIGADTSASAYATQRAVTALPPGRASHVDTPSFPFAVTDTTSGTPKTLRADSAAQPEGSSATDSLAWYPGQIGDTNTVNVAIRAPVSTDQIRPPTFQEQKRPPDVFAESGPRNPNLYGAAAEQPVGKRAIESAPPYPPAVSDTTRGTPKPLLASTVFAATMLTENIPLVRYPGEVVDTSRGTPIVLRTVAAVPPGKQQTASAPGFLLEVHDTSVSAPIRAVQALPVGKQQTASTPAPLFLPPDASAGSPAVLRQALAAPVGAQQTASAPDFIRQVTDTSVSAPIRTAQALPVGEQQTTSAPAPSFLLPDTTAGSPTVLRQPIQIPPPSNEPFLSPQWMPPPPADTSAGTPKTLLPDLAPNLPAGGGIGGGSGKRRVPEPRRIIAPPSKYLYDGRMQGEDSGIEPFQWTQEGFRKRYEETPQARKPSRKTLDRAPDIASDAPRKAVPHESISDGEVARVESTIARSYAKATLALTDGARVRRSTAIAQGKANEAIAEQERISGVQSDNDLLIMLLLGGGGKV